mmetsp:Transcript_3471/g.8260  ORF Transcript_3471/g.8260 Transcript_3471/m.8260 type:complete len:207 (-) Transcript_3471:1816-2436(-)
MRLRPTTFMPKSRRKRPATTTRTPLFTPAMMSIETMRIGGLAEFSPSTYFTPTSGLPTRTGSRAMLCLTSNEAAARRTEAFRPKSLAREDAARSTGFCKPYPMISIDPDLPLITSRSCYRQVTGMKRATKLARMPWRQTPITTTWQESEMPLTETNLWDCCTDDSPVNSTFPKCSSPETIPEKKLFNTAKSSSLLRVTPGRLLRRS